ncbi:MAG: hypothetical protein RLZZ282_1818 [Verrucomicrobiota bacterium]|jgi:hypothetical protein
MRESLIVIGLIVLALALRSARNSIVRKLGALTFLGASFSLCSFLTHSHIGGLAGVGIWLFLPWIELLTRIRRMRLPLDNRLSHAAIPHPKFFPNAQEACAAMEAAGFEHVSDCGWEWDGMHQFFRLFWHPEERAVAAVCLCEQSEVAFAFITITSHDSEGKIWRTTNFPFSTTLHNPPHVRWNHVPCECHCFHQILRDHRQYLTRVNVPPHHLRMPDPEDIPDAIEREMRLQVDHNLSTGIISLTGDGYFRYSKRGLFFLWGQAVKDMARLC